MHIAALIQKRGFHHLRHGHLAQILFGVLVPQIRAQRASIGVVAFRCIPLILLVFVEQTQIGLALIDHTLACFRSVLYRLIAESKIDGFAHDEDLFHLFDAQCKVDFVGSVRCDRRLVLLLFVVVIINDFGFGHGQHSANGDLVELFNDFLVEYEAGDGGFEIVDFDQQVLVVFFRGFDDFCSQNTDNYKLLVAVLRVRER
mmetsp:Transcript_63820/g.101571  ORF Transcript_63820/g.101571 Transcript_63820/m.101571 type:complete len:201 (-) Transcript_63820:313-915(-)